MFLGHLILTLLIVIPFDQEMADIRVRITMFEVPSMIVPRMIASSAAEDGGVEGTMVGGNTTGSFPVSVVFLQDRLVGNSDNVEKTRAIRAFMAHGCIRATEISLSEFAVGILDD